MGDNIIFPKDFFLVFKPFEKVYMHSGANGKGAENSMSSSAPYYTAELNLIKNPGSSGDLLR